MNIICPYRDCQQRIGVTPEDAGTQASCPACDRPLKVPELSAFPPEEAVGVEVDGLDTLETPSRLDGPAVLEVPDFSRPPDPAPPADSIAGCPQCRKILGPKAQQVVSQLIELRQTGAKVNGLRIDCSICGEDVRFHDIVWIDEELRVVHIATDVPPCPETGACPLTVPLRAGKYVLEFAAGTANAQGLAVGDRIIILSEPELR